jgi:hypothetical protein
MFQDLSNFTQSVLCCIYNLYVYIVIVRFKLKQTNEPDRLSISKHLQLYAEKHVSKSMEFLQTHDIDIQLITAQRMINWVTECTFTIFNTSIINRISTPKCTESKDSKIHSLIFFNLSDVSFNGLRWIWILYKEKSYIHLHSLTFCANMLGDRMERNIMISCNDKIDLKNKLNIGECIIFYCREFKFILDALFYKFYIIRFL